MYGPGIWLLFVAASARSLTANTVRSATLQPLPRQYTTTDAGKCTVASRQYEFICATTGVYILINCSRKCMFYVHARRNFLPLETYSLY